MCVKMLFYRDFSKLTDQLKKRIEMFDVVSFDVFDTLIKRNVGTPEDVFILMEKEAQNKGITDFPRTRERIARQLFDENPYCKLDDIYINLEKYCNNHEVRSLQQLEIKLEKELAYPNYEIEELYNYCISRNKKIIAISDMYLDTSLIRALLNKCGYDIEEIYVSCDCRSRKGDGSLFNYVSKKSNIEKEKWVHVGDSLRRDYYGAITAGIKAIHINRKYNRIVDYRIEHKSVSDRKTMYLRSIWNNRIPYLDGYYKKFGYIYLGALVYSFVKWLADACHRDRINRVYFFSRDGYILKKAFDMLETDIESRYYYISRRAVRIPYAHEHNDYADVLKMLPPTRVYNAKIFLEVLGINPEENMDNVKSVGLSMEEDILRHDLILDSRYEALFELVKKDFIENANIEYKSMLKYMQQEGFGGKIGIVDIGWNNTMQFYLENMACSKDYNLFGYYLGVNKNAKKVVNSIGFINENSYENVKSVQAFIGLMESVFLAREGSVERYYEFGDMVRAQLLPYEYNSDDVEYKAFEDIGDGMLSFVSDAINFPDDLALSGDEAFKPFRLFGIRPRYCDVQKFANFRYFSEDTVYFAKKEKILTYVLHPSLFKNDILKSRWKVGFLKNVFRIPLPYYFMYKMLRRIK